MIKKIGAYLVSPVGRVPEEYIHFVLMTKLWHCTPEEFDRQPEHMIELHALIYEQELKAERINEKRVEQRSKKQQ